MASFDHTNINGIMSSHHIIREKQEPALLVLGLDHFDDEQLGQLLEWSPSVFATPLMAEKLIYYGIKVDWIVADELDEHLQSDVKHLSTNGRPALDAALHYLVSSGYPSVNVVTDELELDHYISFAAQINLVIFYDQQKIYAVNSGFSKWKPGGEVISVLSPAKDLKFTGLNRVAGGRFETFDDGFFELRFDEPYLFIAESI